jgi:hypothetical protein
MEKCFNSELDAEKYVNLYNTFPHHVKANKIWNKLQYDFVPWNDWQSLITDTKKSNETLLLNLWNILWDFHFSECEITEGYEIVCHERGYIKDKKTFIASKQYLGNIHWDLHFKNIIIKNDKLTVIDRLLERWDILRDFPFIMSLLCYWEMKKDSIYITYIKLFFESYTRFIVWDLTDFFVSFRNNFINYWIVCFNISKKRRDFLERWYWKSISNRLKTHHNFLSFLKSIEW